MKPLAIEELKALRAGDWVWIVDKEDDVSFYARHDEECCVTMYPKTYCDEFAYTTADEFGAFDYSDYGKSWIAYKNKEQAEAKGEIVELPCINAFVDCMDGKERFQVLDRAKHSTLIMSYGCNTKEEAERRLKELQMR